MVSLREYPIKTCRDQNKIMLRAPKAAVIDEFIKVHGRILTGFQTLDATASLTQDPWSSSLGDGETCVLSQGALVEKAAVNYSSITGSSLPSSALVSAIKSPYTHYKAVGVSVIMHPKHPFIPSAHMNVRLFRLFNNDVVVGWWIGGGYDLTPFFAYKEDVVFWHQQAKKTLDSYGSNRYEDYKTACDNYFFLPHREEMRGVGGVFYDKVNDLSFSDAIDLSADVAEAFYQSYCAIFNKRRTVSYTDIHTAYMHYRRTRYAEFNLLYDRGTKFGLHSKGRIDSIFASMPPSLGWSYRLAEDHRAFEDALTPFLQPMDWV